MKLLKLLITGGFSGIGIPRVNVEVISVWFYVAISVEDFEEGSPVSES